MDEIGVHESSHRVYTEFKWPVSGSLPWMTGFVAFADFGTKLHVSPSQMTCSSSISSFLLMVGWPVWISWLGPSDDEGGHGTMEARRRHVQFHLHRINTTNQKPNSLGHIQRNFIGWTLEKGGITLQPSNNTHLPTLERRSLF